MPKINLAIEADSATEMKEILSQLATGSVVEVTQSLNTADKKATEEAEKAAKKEPAKKKKATAKKKEEVSTASTSDTEPSKTGEKVAPTDSETEEVSATADLHPGATKADVQEAMRKAMDKGKRPMIKTCFSRYNAEKLSDLKEEHYGKFITDLETLVGE
ncbi:TPA: hypothetical protein P5Y24_002486 [Enterococcus faecalis]|nr:hypothetical protein [Enterococcus faecalis]